jgi:hypothetical protein
MARYISTEREDTVELHVLNPRNLGESALVDTVRLVNGDAYMIGREKYPELYATTSRTHAVFEASFGDDDPSKLELTVMNMSDKSGTGVVRRTEEAHLHDPLFLEFLTRRKGGAEALSEMDIVDCFNIMSELEATYGVSDDNNKFRVAINRKFHTDRHPGNEAYARAMFDILMAELDQKEKEFKEAKLRTEQP